MQKTFTPLFMKQHCGCYSTEKLKNCSFYNEKEISLTAILNSEIPLKDKYWFVCEQLATKKQNQQIAIAVAEIVLPIYEKHYPENKTSREAIETAKQYMAGHISIENLLKKRRAAADAAVAAYAYAVADDVYAAAVAADAAAYAVAALVAGLTGDAVCAAAYVVACAVKAIAYSGDKQKLKELLQFLIEFCIA